MLTAERLVATEYAFYDNPATTDQTPFGRWTTDPRFPTRHDANQLFDVRCTPDQTDDLLTYLEELYRPTGLRFRKLTLHHGPTADHLLPLLASRGWSVRPTWVTQFLREPQRSVNPDVEIRSIPFDDPEDHFRMIDDADTHSPESYLHHHAQSDRLGGEMIVAYLDGQPAGKTGWYVTDGIARFRGIDTLEAFRKQGVATTMIRYVQEHPTVRAADALTIHVGDDGPVALYEQLGFVKVGIYWSCLKLLERA